jgi:hypothetical protein
MEKDIQAIIKEAAARYGLGYNENKNQPTIKRENGKVDIISKENFDKAFGFKSPSNNEKWMKVPEGKSITWENNKEVYFSLNEEMFLFKYNDEKNVA